MKKRFYLIGFAVLAGCVPPPPEPKTVIPEEKDLEVPTLIKSGFVRLEQAPHHFIDGNTVMKSHVHEYLMYFDVVVNLEKSKHVYPDQPHVYAKSIRKAHQVNCDTQHMMQHSTRYYSEFWGEGERTPAEENPINLTQNYKTSSLSMLGRVVCAQLYRR